MEDCRAKQRGRTWGFLSSGVLSPSFSLVLVHQFKKVTPGPLNVPNNYCFLETVARQEFCCSQGGRAWAEEPCLSGALLQCHRSEMLVRASCCFLHPNVFMAPWHAFPVSRASRSSCFLKSQCQTTCAVHLATYVYEKAVVLVCGSF